MTTLKNLKTTGENLLISKIFCNGLGIKL